MDIPCRLRPARVANVAAAAAVVAAPAATPNGDHHVVGESPQERRGADVHHDAVGTAPVSRLIVDGEDVLALSAFASLHLSLSVRLFHPPEDGEEHLSRGCRERERVKSVAAPRILQGDPRATSSQSRPTRFLAPQVKKKKKAAAFNPSIVIVRFKNGGRGAYSRQMSDRIYTTRSYRGGAC